MLASRGGDPPEIRDGYVDLLGDSEARWAHDSHRLFNRKLFPPVYERFWRPTVSRMFFGLTGPRARRERAVTLEMLGVAKGDRVIDVGCGSDNYTRYLADSSGTGLVVGIDASRAMAARAAQCGGGENLAYAVGDACSLPFEDATFDAACCVGVVHMVDRPMAALDEMVRVLVPGGKLVLLATRRPRRAETRIRRGIWFFGRDQLTDALRERGLVDVQRRTFRRGQFVSARKAGGTNGR
jgi:SAM-dependent methyltransferase